MISFFTNKCLILMNIKLTFTGGHKNLIKGNLLVYIVIFNYCIKLYTYIAHSRLQTCVVTNEYN